jgi:vacuolar-type H+-ATPase subunit I/STV1
MKVFFTKTLAVLILCGSSAYTLAVDYLYRYTNEEGVVVIDYTVPPHFVHKGYDVLNPDGTVSRTVDRALTDEEKANRSSDEYRKRAEAAEAERLREWDESLLLRYSSIEDIEAARDRALSELRIRISILRSNVRSLKQQVESNQAKAADIERSGGSVPVEIVAAIDILQSEIAETERAIDERLNEVSAVDAAFERDMDRFALLLDKVQLRKHYSRADDR